MSFAPRVRDRRVCALRTPRRLVRAWAAVGAALLLAALGWRVHARHRRAAVHGRTVPVYMHMQTQAVQLPETSPTNMHTPAVQIPETSPTNMHMHPLAPIAVTAPQHQRFLLFRDGGRGQGIGNIMNGLLATHLLALSYNRTCCVSHWPSFAKAFTRIPAAACAGVSEATMIKHLSLWNFGSGQVDKNCW